MHDGKTDERNAERFGNCQKSASETHLRLHAHKFLSERRHNEQNENGIRRERNTKRRGGGKHKKKDEGSNGENDGDLRNVEDAIRPDERARGVPRDEDDEEEHEPDLPPERNEGKCNNCRRVETKRRHTDDLLKERNDRKNDREHEEQNDHF